MEWDEGRKGGKEEGGRSEMREKRDLETVEEGREEKEKGSKKKVD